MPWSSRVVDKHWKRKRPPLLPGEPDRDEYVYLVRVVDKEGGPPHWQVRESCVAYNQSYSWCGPFKTLARGREVFEHWTGAIDRRIRLWGGDLPIGTRVVAGQYHGPDNKER